MVDLEHQSNFDFEDKVYVLVELGFVCQNHRCLLCVHASDSDPACQPVLASTADISGMTLQSSAAELLIELRTTHELLCNLRRVFIFLIPTTLSVNITTVWI